MPAQPCTLLLNQRKSFQWQRNKFSPLRILKPGNCFPWWTHWTAAECLQLFQRSLSLLMSLIVVLLFWEQFYLGKHIVNLCYYWKGVRIMFLFSQQKIWKPKNWSSIYCFCLALGLLLTLGLKSLFLIWVWALYLSQAGMLYQVITLIITDKLAAVW